MIENKDLSNEQLIKRLKESYKNLPVLKGFLIKGNKIKVWCPYCNNWHIHTYTHWELEPWDIEKFGSSRTAHCSKNSPFGERGYIIKRFSQDEIRGAIL